MARKKVPRRLARLPSPTIGLSDHRTDRLLEILRDVAIKNQKEQAQPFYSIREVAKRFQMPLSTVSQAYRNLAQEGFLTLVRSSKTVLQGLSYDRRLSVRGFVGLPASMSRFVTQQDYRMFFIHIRRELRLRGFVPVMLFSKREAGGPRTLSERVKAYAADTVVWFQPPLDSHETLLRLSDMGVRILGVTEVRLPFMRSRYEVRRQTSIRQLLRQWKSKHHVHKITLIQSKDHCVPANEALVKAALRELKIEHKIEIFNGKNTEKFIRRLQRERTDGLVFPSSALPSMFSFRRPRAVAELLTAQRVALMGGPVNMPFAKLPNALVDIVTVNWQLVAERIVNDLITQEAFRKSGPTIFEAQALLRVPLNQFAQQI